MRIFPLLLQIFFFPFILADKGGGIFRKTGGIFDNPAAAGTPMGFGRRGEVTHQLSIGLVVPQTAFGQREYTRAINTALSSFQRSRGPKLEFFKKYQFGSQQIRQIMMKLTPSPTGT